MRRNMHDADFGVRQSLLSAVFADGDACIDVESDGQVRRWYFAILRKSAKI